MPAPTISNQMPAPGATDIGLRPQFQFQVNDGGSGVDFTSLQFWVQGVLAYDQGAGGFQPGFVPQVDWNVPGFVIFFSNTIQAFLYQLAFLPDSTLVTLRVRVTDIGAANVLDTTWTFNTATSPVNHGPYIINPVNDNYISNLNGVFNAFDPIRFDLICDPITGNAIDTTTLTIFIDGFTQVVSGGVTQAGWTFNSTPITNGLRCEFQQNPIQQWNFALFNWGISNVQGTVGGSSGNVTIPLSTTESPVIVYPPNVGTFAPGQAPPFPVSGNVPPNWTGMQPAQGFINLISGLGSPVLDTLVVVQNGGGPITIYDSGMGGFQGPAWAGSQASAQPLSPDTASPFNQGQNILFGPTGAFANVGDTLAFTVTGHKVSPYTGVTYPFTWTWTWNVINTIQVNTNPNSGSVNEPQNVIWQLFMNDFSNVALIQFNSIQATITPTVGPPVTTTVYTGGSFQAGWTGAGSNVQNNGTSSVTVNVDKSTQYNPGDQVSFFNLNAQASNVGESAPSGPYTFTVLNVTYHVFQRGFDSNGTNGYCYWLSATPDTSPGATTPQFTGTLVSYELIYQF